MRFPHSPRRLACLVLVFAAALGGCTTAIVPGDGHAGSAAAQNAPTKRAQLRQALAHADRLTVSAAVTDGAFAAPQNLGGSANVMDFLDNLEIDEAYGPVHSDCPSDALFQFYAGDKLLATLSLHRLDHVRWENGPWGASDAVISVNSAQWLQQWAKQEGGSDITVLIQGIAARETEAAAAARKRMLTGFTPEARALFDAADDVVYNSHHIRQIATPLAALYRDKAALAELGLRALGETSQRWLEDDWTVGAIQTALLDLEPATVTAAMDRLRGDQKASLGAARFFLRTGFDAKLPPAERSTRGLEFADLVLRTGRNSDKPTALECVALIPGEAVAGFLRAIAVGEKTYAYAAPCDEITLATEEPGLRYAAALLMAKRADPGAAEVMASLARLKLVGPDQAALEIGAALLNNAAPLSPAHFKYRSRLLGLSALAALEWRPGSRIPLDLLAAACAHFQEDVASRAEKIAQHYQFQRTDEATSGDDLAIDYDPLLVSSHPQLAVQEYSALIPKVSGAAQIQLYLLRARAYSAIGDFAAAEADYLTVEKSPYVDNTDARTRLAWIQWYLGEFIAAESTIQDALQSDPNAELVLLRGIMHYALDDFRRSTESDLIAARVLDPTEGYAALFQHLTASLGGRPEQSQLKTYLSTAPDLPDWPRQVIGFMLGYIDAPQLLEVARTSEPGEVAWHTCEATFYISQAARIAGRSDEERRYLEQCAATNQPNVAEFWVAKYRLARLRASKNLSPSRSAPSNTPAI
jgi:lipoprotein NlpI